MRFPESKIVPDGVTVRLAHFVGRNVNLIPLNKLRDRFMFQMDGAKRFHLKRSGSRQILVKSSYFFLFLRAA